MFRVPPTRFAMADTFITFPNLDVTRFTRVKGATMNESIDFIARRKATELAGEAYLFSSRAFGFLSPRKVVLHVLLLRSFPYVLQAILRFQHKYLKYPLR